MRKIIHIDMDAFFASVEQRDNKKIRGKPVAVGGRPNNRGVVSTASYEARKYGIHSAMPMATAIRLCPNLIILPSRHSVYREESDKIRDIFTQFTDIIEPISIDEAYLDVSNNLDFNGSATLLANHIIKTIFKHTGLTASAGISYCKFLAKYSSNINKPNGIFTITPKQAQTIIDKMPVEKIHGIGPVTQKHLNNQGIINAKDLRQADLNKLTKILGNNSKFYHSLAHGIDNRKLKVNRERKSIGNEITFNRNTTDINIIYNNLQEILRTVWHSLSSRNIVAMTATLKIKYYDFNIHTRSYTDKNPITSLATAELIIKLLLSQKGIKKPVRLIGITFSQLSKKRIMPLQPRLFD